MHTLNPLSPNPKPHFISQPEPEEFWARPITISQQFFYFVPISDPNIIDWQITRLFGWLHKLMAQLCEILRVFPATTLPPNKFRLRYAYPIRPRRTIVSILKYSTLSSLQAWCFQIVFYHFAQYIEDKEELHFFISFSYEEKRFFFHLFFFVETIQK